MLAVAPSAGGAGQGAQRSCGVRVIGAGSGGAHPGQLLTPPRPRLALDPMPLAASGEDAGDAEPVGEVAAVGVGERAAPPAARIGAGRADVGDAREVVLDR